MSFNALRCTKTNTHLGTIPTKLSANRNSSSRLNNSTISSSRIQFINTHSLQSSNSPPTLSSVKACLVQAIEKMEVTKCYLKQKSSFKYHNTTIEGLISVKLLGYTSSENPLWPTSQRLLLTNKIFRLVKYFLVFILDLVAFIIQNCIFGKCYTDSPR